MLISPASLVEPRRRVLDIPQLFPRHRRSIAHDASQQFLRGGFEPIPAAALDDRPGQLLRLDLLDFARVLPPPFLLEPSVEVEDRNFRQCSVDVRRRIPLRAVRARMGAERLRPRPEGLSLVRPRQSETVKKRKVRTILVSPPSYAEAQCG